VLDQLQIHNLALIDEVSLEFSKGLNILSGETGAGKSIIIKAVNLLLGEKPTPDTIRKGAQEATVEGLFSVPAHHPLVEVLDSLGLPGEEQILVKRTVQSGGKSRAWINGSLTNQSVLSRITRSLIGISNQHEYQSLLHPSEHLSLLDHYGGLMALREDIEKQFEHLEGLIKTRRDLIEKEATRKSQKELWAYQRQEIEQAHLQHGEDQELLLQKRILLQTEKIWEKMAHAQQGLSEEEHSVLNTLSRSKDLIRSVVQVDPSLQPIYENLESIQTELNEINLGIRDYLANLVFDPKRLDQVEERLDRIQRLTAKYGPTVEDVLNYLDQLEEKVKEGEDLEYHLQKLTEKIQAQRSLLLDSSRELSQKRKVAGSHLTRQVEEDLQGLGMGGCQFQILFTPLAPEGKLEDDYSCQGMLLSPSGIEKGEFHIAPNPGEGLRPLARIASGGELSRILLVLKGLLSHQDALETLIFDEVDSGIGGGLGQAVGRKLRRLAQSHQVVCITHLPQIAAFAERHFQVAKETCNSRTRTKIQRLEAEAQPAELARMLGGTRASTETLSMARELLREAGRDQESL
jgi:DNA repair protein RecN (Recombination protein N)